MRCKRRRGARGGNALRRKRRRRPPLRFSHHRCDGCVLPVALLGEEKRRKGRPPVFCSSLVWHRRKVPRGGGVEGSRGEEAERDGQRLAREESGPAPSVMPPLLSLEHCCHRAIVPSCLSVSSFFGFGRGGALAVARRRCKSGGEAERNVRGRCKRSSVVRGRRRASQRHR